MRLPLSALWMAVALAIIFPLSRSVAAEEVSFQVFYDSLAAQGDWISVDGYGYCWRPKVESTWRPYTVGSWSMTEQGWTWVSTEDWGWATYHYGRWAHLDSLGWVWVPGTEWAPAWVSWRSNNDYIGWAPLPPEAAWTDAGFDSSVDVSSDIGPGYYNFCPAASLGSSPLLPALLSANNSVMVFINTKNITAISRRDGQIYGGGPDFETTNRQSSKPIPSYRLLRSDSAAAFHPEKTSNTVEGSTITVSAPRFVSTPDAQPATIKDKATSTQATRGWNTVPSESTRALLRQTSRSQFDAQRSLLPASSPSVPAAVAQTPGKPMATPIQTAPDQRRQTQAVPLQQQQAATAAAEAERKQKIQQQFEQQQKADAQRHLRAKQEIQYQQQQNLPRNSSTNQPFPPSQGGNQPRRGY